MENDDKLHPFGVARFVSSKDNPERFEERKKITPKKDGKPGIEKDKGSDVTKPVVDPNSHPKKPNQN